MYCPRCQTTLLRATRLEDGLVGESCQSCQGALVGLAHYRDWAERAPLPQDAEAGAPAADVQPVPDGQRALRCPKCSRLMSRYRIGHGVSNALDLCPACDEAWLDGGEWRLLRALQLSRHVPRIFTQAWQHRIRAEQQAQTARERLRQQLGEEDAAKTQALREWLQGHPKRNLILQWLNWP